MTVPSRPVPWPLVRLTCADYGNPTAYQIGGHRRQCNGAALGQRYSIVRFSPSTNPPSFRPPRNPSSSGAAKSLDAPCRKPITGVGACCARAADERDELAPLNVNPSGVVPPSMSIVLGFPRLGQRPKFSSASRLTAARSGSLDLSQSAASPGAAVRVLALGEPPSPRRPLIRLL